MRLNHFKLLSSFRGLPKNFKVGFAPQDQKAFEPICLVGLNGSGKSNVLEVLAEFFFYLENCFNSQKYSKKHIESFSSNWGGFELSYCYLSLLLSISCRIEQIFGSLFSLLKLKLRLISSKK